MTTEQITKEIKKQEINDSSDLPFKSSAMDFFQIFEKLKIDQDYNKLEYAFPEFQESEIAVEFKNYSMGYGTGPHVLYNVSLQIPRNKIIAIIGPSGCGKSTFLRSINRMNEEVANTYSSGEILIDNEEIMNEDMDIMELRTKVGMVFQKPQPFPRSIYDNITFGPKLHGINSHDQLDKIVEFSLNNVGLWNEVNNRLDQHAFSLSGGQQQRLCIARAIAVNPNIILGDEPASALDPKSTYQIEDLLLRLKENYTVIIVTHNMQQAARISDYCIFMYNGNIIEYSKTDKMFENPFFNLTENYISGKFG